MVVSDSAFWSASDRDVQSQVVARVGSVSSSPDPKDVPWRLLDADGSDVPAGAAWLRDLWACGHPSATLRSYAFDLLGWFRFLDAVDVEWGQATRAEVRDWVLWHKARDNAQRLRTSVGGRPAAGTVNVKTGKPYLPGSYARSYINHRLSAVSNFYDFAVETDLGPLVNPVPKARRLAGMAVDDRREPIRKRAAFRQKVPVRAPRALSDELYDEVFAALRTTQLSTAR